MMCKIKLPAFYACTLFTRIIFTYIYINNMLCHQSPGDRKNFSKRLFCCFLARHAFTSFPHGFFSVGPAHRHPPSMYFSKFIRLLKHSPCRIHDPPFRQKLSIGAKSHNKNLPQALTRSSRNLQSIVDFYPECFPRETEL